MLLEEAAGLIDSKVARVLAARSCLAFYEAYLVECRYDYYLMCWDSKCQFKDYCLVLLRSFENYESFCLTGGRGSDGTGFRPAHDVAGDSHLMESRTLVGVATKGYV